MGGRAEDVVGVAVSLAVREFLPRAVGRHSLATRALIDGNGFVLRFGDLCDRSWTERGDRGRPAAIPTIRESADSHDAT